MNIIGFAHAVAARVDPSLQDRPVVVTPGISRSLILDLSPHAFSFGIRKGMAIERALHLCPDCIIIPPRFDLYHRAMTALYREVRPFSPCIEHGVADGHLFADLSGTSKLFGASTDVARRICNASASKLGLKPGWAIGPNKLVAKVASRISRSQGECEVSLGTEATFLAPHSLKFLPGARPEELRNLDDFCITAMGDAVHLNLGQLQILLDHRASFYHDACRGIDPLPVGQQYNNSVRSVFNFAGDTNDRQQIRAVISLLGTHLSLKLRKQQSMARRLSLSVTYTDNTSRTIRIRLQQRLNNDRLLSKSVQGVLPRILKKRLRIRTLSLGAEQLVQASQQLTLFPQGNQQPLDDQKLLTALDQISRKFGKKTIHRGRALPVKGAL